MSLSALQAGVDRKTARKYLQTQQPPDQLQKPHTWRTRADPLAKIWPKAEQMLSDAPELEGKSLFEFFLVQPDSGLEASHLRTFHRRIQWWRATHGPEKEVYFPQRQTPGLAMQLDWTNANELGVNICGSVLEHLLCHCVLPYSNWQWAIRCQSESFLSLVSGLQASLGRLGKKPRLLGTDHSSAATHEIGQGTGQRAFNPDYLDLCQHYDLSPVTINVACPHEHGDVESQNGHQAPGTVSGCAPAEPLAGVPTVPTQKPQAEPAPPLRLAVPSPQASGPRMMKIGGLPTLSLAPVVLALARGYFNQEGLQVELVSLLGSLPALEREVETAERRAANLELGAAWERRGIGLNFEMVDEGALPGRAARVRAALWVFGSALLCGLPLVAVTVGAFAPSPRGRV